ncbi:MAG: Nudix family hydrolase [Cellvibrio sp.]|uniref:Nudix family hydrolase n=1 Tax=Cellvibrio sp. TaxID=1965322 RepID=UPI0031A8D01B
MAKLVHVTVGVIMDNDGKIFIAKRPLDTHQGGLWEFPGGKVDANETIQQALVRELREELAIEVLASEPLIQIRHHYPDKSVLLDVHKITQFSGEPCGNEGQPVQWVEVRDLHKFEFPAANRPIIAAISLPSRYLITGGFQSHSDFSERLTGALNAGVRLVQLRVDNFDLTLHQGLLDILFSAVNGSSADVVINCSPAQFIQIGEIYPNFRVGLHLNSLNAAQIDSRPVDRGVLFGVSCHTAEEIVHAQKIGADYLLLSPVLPTTSHPHAAPLGWNSFSKLVELANVPVYALGGVGEEQIQIAQRCGAQGVAGISAWW